MIHCLKHILRTEGVWSLYRGYTTTFLMNIPYASIYYASYESSKKLWRSFLESFFPSHFSTNHQTRYDTITHLLSGGVAGTLAGGITNPLDVTKTRLQVGEDGGHGKPYRGMMNTMKRIWKEHGWCGYLRGIKPRMAFHATSAAICWTTYEYVKFVLYATFFEEEFSR